MDIVDLAKEVHEMLFWLRAGGVVFLATASGFFVWALGVSRVGRESLKNGKKLAESSDRQTEMQRETNRCIDRCTDVIDTQTHYLIWSLENVQGVKPPRPKPSSSSS